MERRCFYVIACMLLGLMVSTAAVADPTEATKSSDVEDEELIYLIFTPKCFDVFVEGLDQLFLKMDIVGVFQKFNYYLPCALKIISKALGYGIVVGSGIVKLPQILTILKSSDVTGLSATSFYFDVGCFAVTVIYNIQKGYPFSTYGEAAIVLVQNIFLVFLFWRFVNPSVGILHISTVLLVGGGILSALTMTPSEYLVLLPNIATAMSIACRLPQIITNMQQGHTGQLSFTTNALNLLGSLGRILTTVQETGDKVILFGYMIAVVLNFTLVTQIILFRKATKEAIRQTPSTSQRKGKKQS